MALGLRLNTTNRHRKSVSINLRLDTNFMHGICMNKCLQGLMAEETTHRSWRPLISFACYNNANANAGLGKASVLSYEGMSLERYIFPADSQAALKKKTSIPRSWIVLDSNGEGRIIDVDKHAIMNQVQLHARDLRILDPLMMYPSAILGREKAIVLNLEHIKAIITAQKVILRDAYDDNVIPVVEELRRRLPQIRSKLQGQGDINEQHDSPIDIETAEDENPFEFVVLEVALEAICSFLDARTTELETAAYPALHDLTLKISSRNLDQVRKLKNAMTRLTARVQKVRDELEQLLDDDDDMAELYLSRKLARASVVSHTQEQNSHPAFPTTESKISSATRPSTATSHDDDDNNDVEQLEMLLEAYYIQIDATLSKLTTLREYIDDTEDYINIQLDNHRNQLIKLEFYISTGNLCISIYALVAALFGMNFQYQWNYNHENMFTLVNVVTGVVCVALYMLIIFCARRRGLAASS